MKELFTENGLDSFSDHEVLEFLLYFSIPRHNTNETAHMLLNRYGSLSAVLDAKYSDLVKQPGVGPHSAVLFNFIPQLAKRYTLDKYNKKRAFKSIDEICEFVINHFIDQTREHVELFMFDSSTKLLCHKTLQNGTPNAAFLNIQIIADNIYAYNATNFLIAHNHPSGSLEPSDFDLCVTRTIHNTFRPLNKHLIDHIIVAGGEYKKLLETALSLDNA
ncbi:MAG: RadC family protein [Clostridia bacterium]|nr:RadC family protein [Clostridia bacterium]